MEFTVAYFFIIRLQPYCLAIRQILPAKNFTDAGSSW